MTIVRHHTQWTDPRMAEAYDLIAEVVRDHSTPSDNIPEVASLLADIDKADELLAGILHDRRAT